MITYKKYCLLFLLLMSSSFCFAEESKEKEQTELQMIIRQFDFIQMFVEQKSHQSVNHRSHYYFNYKRLNADLKHIRAGIDDYLTPVRAQPRDPLEFTDDYIQENRSQ